MKIGIDVRMIQSFPTGIGNYLENLIKALAKTARRDALQCVSTEFVLVGNAGNKMEKWAKNQPQFEFVAIKSKPNSVHQHFLLPFELWPLKLDLFWTTPWGASIFFWQKYALTIYDLLYRRYPKIASLKARLYEVFVSKWVARRAVVIFTISEFVKNDIVGFLGIKKDKIVNIQGAAGDAYRPLKDGRLQGLALQTLRRRGISKPFFVYVGNFRPHKNLRMLLKAFADVIRQRRIDSRPALVLIGDVDAKGRGSDSKNLLKLFEELKLQDDVILTGRIEDDREVAEILNEAVALVHPSFHEGFGLTFLEAMSCGCPVIAANTTSIPEVVGGAGILVDPQSVDALAKAMSKVLAGECQDLVQRGLAQAKKFSWERSARKVLSTLRVAKLEMIIGIDARTTQNQYKGRGIGNYTEHIIEWLPKVDPTVKIETRDFSRVAVFLQPNFWDGFPKVSCPKVLMMHDLTPLVTNHFTERGALINFAKGILYRLRMQNIKKADAVLTNSEQTKKDVIKYAGVDPNIVHCVYLGVDEEFRTTEIVPNEERGNYILFVGGVEANKNVLRLLEAFAVVKSQIPNPKSQTNSKFQISNIKLIMPGGQFVNREKIETKMIRAKVKELGLENNVGFPGFVEQSGLVELYRKALVFVYPSYYEGFGFPVLEAMASGTPVVSSSASSLPEVGGPPEAGAVVYVDPFDVESIANGIIKVLDLDESTYQRMVQEGLEQAKKFSWEKCARGTLEVLTRVRPDNRV